MSLFHLANGAEVHVMSAKALVRIPVWKNNRIIDHVHASEIARDVNPRMLDHGYHIAILNEEDAGGGIIEQRYIIDGQHRVCVLHKYFESGSEDFPVLFFERRFTTEGELIDYFNAINKCKPVQPWVDENLILNNLVRALEEAFENRRTRVIRSVGCHRPYISAERIREILRNVGIAKFPTSTQGADAWAERVKAWNDAAIDSDYVGTIRSTTKRNFFEKGAKIGFVLAYDERYPWLTQTLN